jgi:hypothetical protein
VGSLPSRRGELEKYLRISFAICASPYAVIVTVAAPHAARPRQAAPPNGDGRNADAALLGNDAVCDPSPTVRGAVNNPCYVGRIRGQCLSGRARPITSTSWSSN